MGTLTQTRPDRQAKPDRQAQHAPEAGNGPAAALPARSDTARRIMSRVRWYLGDTRRKFFWRIYLINAICRLLPEASLSTLRAALYRRAGFRIGPGVTILSAVNVSGSGPEIYEHLTVGEGTIFGLRPTFNLDDKITIGRNVAVGPGVVFYTSTHAIGSASRRMSYNMQTRPIIIEDGVWIGMYSLILPGVVVGHGSVISAGSVVRKSVPPNSLVGGNPAQLIKELPTYED